MKHTALPPHRFAGTWRPTPAMRARRLAYTAGALALAAALGLAVPAALARTRHTD